jgi:hypothetical protein
MRLPWCSPTMVFTSPILLATQPAASEDTPAMTLAVNSRPPRYDVATPKRTYELAACLTCIPLRGQQQQQHQGAMVCWACFVLVKYGGRAALLCCILRAAYLLSFKLA